MSEGITDWQEKDVRGRMLKWSIGSHRFYIGHARTESEQE